MVAVIVISFLPKEVVMEFILTVLYNKSGTIIQPVLGTTAQQNIPMMFLIPALGIPVLALALPVPALAMFSPVGPPLTLAMAPAALPIALALPPVINGLNAPGPLPNIPKLFPMPPPAIPVLAPAPPVAVAPVIN
jgi:hypothetical protein